MTTNILKLFEGVDEVCNGKEKVNLQSALRGKEVLGLYFSAHWCPPCRGFTPNLVAAYNDLKADNKPFEIIFCSSDSDDTSFQNYYDEMPWLALPFSEKDVKTSLSKKYGCKGIPYLVLLDCNTGEEITRD